MTPPHPPGAAAAIADAIEAEIARMRAAGQPQSVIVMTALHLLARRAQERPKPRLEVVE